MSNKEASEWTTLIVEAFDYTRAGCFDIGRLLLEAKKDLPYGEFQHMVRRELPFGQRYAQILMAIADDLRLTKCVSLLPLSVGALFELTKLDNATFNAMLDAGEIRPNMTRKDVVGINYKALAEADALRVASLAPVPGRFRTLVIDPPWESGGGRGLTYATMSQTELEDPKRLPVREWLEDESHCYLWCTLGEVENGYRLMRLWDVEPQSLITWIKPQFSMGYHFRSQTEHVIFGTRGGLRTRAAARAIPTFFHAPTRTHSEKPDMFYDIVRAASYEPIGEAFQRIARPGFAGLYAARESRFSSNRRRLDEAEGQGVARRSGAMGASDAGTTTRAATSATVKRARAD